MKKLIYILLLLLTNVCVAQPDTAQNITKRAPVFGFKAGAVNMINPYTPNFQILFEKNISENSSVNLAYGYIFISGLEYRENQKGTLLRLGLRHYYSEKKPGHFVSFDLMYKNFYYLQSMYVGYNCIGQNKICDYYKVEDIGFMNNYFSVLGSWGFQNPVLSNGKLVMEMSFSAGAVYKSTVFKNYSPKENTFANLKVYRRAKNNIGDIGLDALVNLNFGIMSYQK